MKRSATRLLNSQAVEAASTSSYKKTKQKATKEKQDPVCSYCGKTGYGKSALARIRKKTCPAYGHKCLLCNRDHHMEDVCRSKDNPKISAKAEDCEGAVFDTLCTISASRQKRHGESIAIDHHTFDLLSDTWIRKNSKPQPYIDLTVKVVP